jgi:hypothetical protein
MNRKIGNRGGRQAVPTRGETGAHNSSMLARAWLGCQAQNDKLELGGRRQPSPLGRGCTAAGVFISRSGPGEGTLAPSWVAHPWREGVKEPRMCHPEAECVILSAAKDLCSCS